MFLYEADRTPYKPIDRCHTVAVWATTRKDGLQQLRDARLSSALAVGVREPDEVGQGVFELLRVVKACGALAPARRLHFLEECACRDLITLDSFPRDG